MSETIIYYVDFINNVLIIFYEFVCSVSISSDLIDLLYIETFGDICGTVNICSSSVCRILITIFCHLLL
jgi:hypothetical protein